MHEARSDAEATDTTLVVIQQFNDAFNRHDVDAIMSLMTEDCVFENTLPPPDGARYEGASAVRAFWEAFFRDAPNAHFGSEEVFACSDRAVVRWTYHWSAEGHVRGVDVMRVRDGKVAEKLAYVKG
jgi:ketosteroid isomerase-like protein